MSNAPRFLYFTVGFDQDLVKVMVEEQVVLDMEVTTDVTSGFSRPAIRFYPRGADDLNRGVVVDSVDSGLDFEVVCMTVDRLDEVVVIVGSREYRIDWLEGYEFAYVGCEWAASLKCFPRDLSIGFSNQSSRIL